MGNFTWLLIVSVQGILLRRVKPKKVFFPVHFAGFIDKPPALRLHVTITWALYIQNKEQQGKDGLVMT
jgi:hypothetical protein